MNDRSSERTEYDRRYAGDYMDTDEYSGWAQAELNVRQVVDTLRRIPVRPATALDFGCGVGAWVPVLAQMYPGLQIAGVEVSGTAVEKARARYPEYDFRVLDGRQSPFEDGSFDLVFSYHVLEHVDELDNSIHDICRMVRPGGHACIIYPCGNAGSFLDRKMGLIEHSKALSPTGERAFFFEIPDGHVRRITSDETIALFAKHGMTLNSQRFSGHFFGDVDWLVSGTSPEYIDRLFAARPARTRLGRFNLALTRRGLVGMNRLLKYRSVEPNPGLNGVGDRIRRLLARMAKAGIAAGSELEWRYLSRRSSGSAQFLVFSKPVDEGTGADTAVG